MSGILPSREQEHQQPRAGTVPEPVVYVATIDGKEYDIESKDGSPPTEADARAVIGHAARVQSDERPGAYLVDTAKSIPGDLVTQAKGFGDLLKMTGAAAGEVGMATGSRLREMVGLDPHYGGTENLDALTNFATGFVPGVIAHYTDKYGTGDARALQVRDHPVGTFLDIAGAVEGVKGGYRGAKAAPAVIKAIAKDPTVGTLANAALLGYGSPTLKAAAKLGKAVKALGGEAAPSALSFEERFPTPSVLGPNAPPLEPSEGLAAALAKERAAAQPPPPPEPPPTSPLFTRSGTGMDPTASPLPQDAAQWAKPPIPPDPSPLQARTGTGLQQGPPVLPQDAAQWPPRATPAPPPEPPPRTTTSANDPGQPVQPKTWPKAAPPPPPEPPPQAPPTTGTAFTPGAMPPRSAPTPAAATPAAAATPTAAVTQADMMREILKRQAIETLAKEPDWARQDVVKVDRIKSDITQGNGGSIIEAGESIPGLARRVAELTRQKMKAPAKWTPALEAELDRLSRAYSQHTQINESYAAQKP